jgi:hypothetical protein
LLPVTIAVIIFLAGDLSITGFFETCNDIFSVETCRVGAIAYNN